MRRAAITHSKLRDVFGLVGIEATLNRVTVKTAHQWDRKDMHRLPEDTSRFFRRLNWGKTYTDQLIGEHLITELRQFNVPMEVISTQKNMKDPHDLERIKRMDLVEAVQFVLSLLQKKILIFPKNPSKNMLELEEQMAMFTEKKTTEAGDVTYYGPGETIDCLPKALIIGCFSVRHIISRASRRAYFSPVPIRGR